MNWLREDFRKGMLKIKYILQFRNIQSIVWGLFHLRFGVIRLEFKNLMYHISEAKYLGLK